jgi:3-hydroxypropanoate dehydrogenase
MSLDPGVLDALFHDARTHYGWTDQYVSDAQLRAVFDTMRWGPTSANSSPARFIFVRSPDAKNKLRPALSAGNVEKTMTAQATVIVAYDPRFYEWLPRLLPLADVRGYFESDRALAEDTAFRNSSLQGGYFIIAARAHGLDCGPMSGFDKDAVEAAFLTEHGWKANFLINLGHGDPAAVPVRNPRLDFFEACRFV